MRRGARLSRHDDGMRHVRVTRRGRMRRRGCGIGYSRMPVRDSGMRRDGGGRPGDTVPLPRRRGSVRRNRMRRTGPPMRRSTRRRHRSSGVCGGMRRISLRWCGIHRFAARRRGDGTGRVPRSWHRRGWGCGGVHSRTPTGAPVRRCRTLPPRRRHAFPPCSLRPCPFAPAPIEQSRRHGDQLPNEALGAAPSDTRPYRSGHIAHEGTASTGPDQADITAVGAARPPPRRCRRRRR
ncbi:Uncharacterised protein [Nocardia farcinica]|nr:Uncharacterised protein [Nocardia farcinica]